MPTHPTLALVATALTATLLAGCTAPPAAPPAPAPTTAPAPSVCQAVTEAEIAALFDRWNAALQTGDPHKVVALYAPHSILLPTVSNQPRFTPAEKEDYFHHFLANQPSGRIDLRRIELGCNMAVDAGLYTFAFSKTGGEVKARYTYTYRWDGRQWLITSHHSSAMPEKP